MDKDDALEDVSEEEGSEEAQFSDDDDDDNEDEEEEEEEDDSDEEDGDEEEAEGSEGEDDESGEEGEGEEDDDDWETEDEDDLLEASDSDGNEDAEKCPICLNRIREQDIGTPEACDHVFCLECIQEWAKNVNTCPVDRQVFRLILCKHSGEDKIYRRIPVEDRNTQAEDDDEEPTYCEVCHQCDREDRLLLCDGCDQGYHLDCLSPPLSNVPVDEWFCPECADREGWAEEADDTSEMAQITAENEVNIPRRSRRQIPRTLVSERVRSAIEEIRVRRTRSIRRIVSSEEEEEENVEEGETPPSPAATPSPSTTTRKPVTKRKTTRRRKTPRKYKKRKTTKTKKKTTRKRKTTRKKKTTRKRKTTKKTPGKTTKRKGRKRRKKRKVSKKVRTARPQSVTTVKSRIASSLGLVNPPKGTTIPLQKQKAEKTTEMRRTEIGASSLSIFGARDELIGFNDEPKSPGHDETKKPSKYSRMSRSSYKPIGRVPIIIPSGKQKKKEVTVTTPPASTSTAPLDLLGSIMQGQTKLHLSSRDITIQKDGSLLEKPKEIIKPKPKPKISFSIGKSSPSKTPGSLFKTSQHVISPTSSSHKFELKKGSDKAGKPSLPANSGSIGFQPNVFLNEEYDPAHPTDELEEIGTNVVETKMVQDDDIYDPFHPTGEIESDEDDKTKSEIHGKKTTQLKSMSHSKKELEVQSLDKENRVDSKRNSFEVNAAHNDESDHSDQLEKGFEAVSPDGEGDFDESAQSLNDKENVADGDDDKSTDLEDEIEYTGDSDKVVILINQEEKNACDRNKQENILNSENQKGDKEVSCKKENMHSNNKANEIEQKRKTEKPEALFEPVDENKEIKAKKSILPPKPGFHGGLPQVLLPHQLKVVTKINDKEKSNDTHMAKKDTKTELSEIPRENENNKTGIVQKQVESQKVSPVQKSLDFVKKSQFKNRQLYGEIDFSEDVSFSESGFPQKFEVNLKRIEDAFKDTLKDEEQQKDDVEIIEEVPEELTDSMNDSKLEGKNLKTLKETEIEMGVSQMNDKEESEILAEGKNVKNKHPDITVEYVKKVKDKKEKGIPVEYVKSVKDPRKSAEKKSDRVREDSKKFDDKAGDKKSKTKNSKDKNDNDGKIEKQNKVKKKSKRKVSIDEELEEDEDNYRKELRETREFKEHKKSKDVKRKLKEDFSDEEEYLKTEKVRKSHDDSKKSRHDRKKSREESFDRRKSREDSFDKSIDRRKSREGSYDRRRLREDSRDKRKPREHSSSKKKSREDSYEKRKSRDDSYERSSHDKRKARDDSYDRRKVREDSYDYSDSWKKTDRHRKLSEDDRILFDDYIESHDDHRDRKNKHKKSSDEIRRLDDHYKGRSSEKKKSKDKQKKVHSEKLSLGNDYESISEDEILSDIDDPRENWSEIEEGELQDEYWYKEKRKKDKRERKRDNDDRANRTMFYEETEDGEILYSDKAKLLKSEQDIDTRIVIQVSQNTENRRVSTVWEEEDKRKKKRKKEAKEKDEKKKKESELKKEKKSRHHRSRSRSKDHRDRSRSKERKIRSRSRSHDRSKKKRRDYSRSGSRDRLYRSHSRDRSYERSNKKKRRRGKSRDRSIERERSWDRSRDSSESLDMGEIYGDSEKSWSGSPYRKHENPSKRHDSHELLSVEKRNLSPSSQTLMCSILKQETGEFKVGEFSAKRKAETSKTVQESKAKKSKPDSSEVKSKTKKVVQKPELVKINAPVPKLPKTLIKEGLRPESPIIIPEDKDEEKNTDSDSEPEETEQFSYTDRDEYLLQNKNQQQHTNLIKIVQDSEKQKGPPSPALPPSPDLKQEPTPPLPVLEEPPFVSNQFPPPPPGPPPGMVITSERPPVHHVQVSGPPGQGILGDGAVLIRGLPPHSETLPGGPQLIQHGANLPQVPVGINVLPPGFPQGLPQPLRPQRPILVNAFMNQPPPGFSRLPGSPGTVPQLLQNPISSQIPSPGAQIPGPQVVNGPFEALPPEAHPTIPPPGFPPGEPQHLVQIQTEGPPHNLVSLQHELDGPPIGPPPGSLSLPVIPEPQLIQITSNPHDPRLPIPLHLPPPSPELPPNSVIVSLPPPASVMTSVAPLQNELLGASVTGISEEAALENTFIRAETPPNSVAPVHVANSPPPTQSVSKIPGLGDLDVIPSESGAPVDAGLVTASKASKDELPIFSQLEEISKLLNVQAKLKIISSHEKRNGKSPANDNKSDDSLFKVPLPPGQKSGNNATKGDSVEINEVTDMDMGSPIDEQGNIELPVSPQYENLIDKPEDLVDDTVSKNLVDDTFSKKLIDDTVTKMLVDDTVTKKMVDDTVSTKLVGETILKKTDTDTDTDNKDVALDLFSCTLEKEEEEELEDIQDSFENKLDAIGLLKDIESLTRAINAETIAKKESDLNKIRDSEKTDKKVSFIKNEEKSKHSKENRHHKHGSHRHHKKHKTEEEKTKTKDLRLKALTDAHLEIDSQEMPSSAVEMTNKEKYLQKLHLQERVVEEVKMAIKPHYASKDITKEQYKEILRKAVPKICHSKSGDINPMKIKSLIEAYVSKCNKPKSKSDTDSVKSNSISPTVKANGERGKQKTNR